VSHHQLRDGIRDDRRQHMTAASGALAGRRRNLAGVRLGSLNGHLPACRPEDHHL